MTTRHALRRWEAVRQMSEPGEELVAPQALPDALVEVLTHLSAALPDGTPFVIVRMAASEGAALRQTAEAANRAEFDFRICLALGAEQLTMLDASTLGGDRISVMLDDVDEKTCLHEFIGNGIEAVRFREDFVFRASRNLRLGCALDSMLHLARNLGLRTFGAPCSAGDSASSSTPEFDYVPAPRDCLAGDLQPLQRSSSAGFKSERMTQVSR